MFQDLACIRVLIANICLIGRPGAPSALARGLERLAREFGRLAVPPRGRYVQNR